MAAVWRLAGGGRHREQPLRRVQPACGHDAQSRAFASGRPPTASRGCSSTATTCSRSRAVAAEAFARARAGEGPTLIEADTYRHEGHSRSDPAKYRPEGELEQWLLRDPIPRFEEVVRPAGVADAEELGSIRAEVAAEVKAALERAKSWPEPSLERLLEDVYR